MVALVSHWSGPIGSGTKKDPDAAGLSNVGLCLLGQTVRLEVDGANAVTSRLDVPLNSRLVDFKIDVLEAWASSVSDTLTIGTAAAGTQYVSGVDAQAAGRATPTLSAAQLLAMSDVGSNVGVFVTVTPSGTAGGTGIAEVTALYLQLDSEPGR